MTLLSAPPGSGKTTLIPPQLLAESWLNGNKILLLEPRRLAAKAAATRIAWLLNEKVGERAGYRVRLESRISRQTRIEAVTEGLFIRQLQHDPELNGVGLVIFDEFHERSLDADLGLALALDAQRGLRDDLRLLLMSATLDLDSLRALIPDAAIVRSEGFGYPVEQRYLARESSTGPVPTAIAGVLRALRERGDDILVFLPGSGEIGAVARALQQQLPEQFVICPLYGDLTQEDQMRALSPDALGRRRIVLSTSIAESSLTLEGIGTVVDSGWSRRPQFDPNSGLTLLRTVRVSQASADQRSGRAGRLGPGCCYRLWTQAAATAFPAQTRAEIVDADLAPLALQLALWGVDEVSALSWLDPPPQGALAQARELLIELQALDQRGVITAHGRAMAGLSLHPRLAHMLLKAGERGAGALAADLAAIISERDILRRDRGEWTTDIETRLRFLDRWRDRGAKAIEEGVMNTSACRRVVASSRQLRESIKGIDGDPETSLSPGELLSFAYPDRIARRREGGHTGYLLTSGRAVRLAQEDPLAGGDYLVIAALDAGAREGRAYLAASICLRRIRAIHQTRIKCVSDVKWDISSQSVLAERREMLGAVALDTQPLDEPDAESVSSAMLEGVRRMGLDSLPWSREARDLQRRVEALRRWRPEGGWPDLSNEALLRGIESWLQPWLGGMTRRKHLHRLDVATIIAGMVGWPGLERLDALAPTHIEVPSGSRKRLEYTEAYAPVLRVRLQEMFGLQQTPSVCDGEVPVMLHLLSPAQRPVQITQDLAGFWQRTYSEVRKELQGRYPKHYWPEDPSQAVAIKGVRPGQKR